MTDSPHTFENLGIEASVLSVLNRLQFTVPTPIQYAAIPPGVEGSDVIGIAQTGTGKTLAFGIPMAQRLAIGGGRGLVIVPTRELALQVDETLQKIGRALKLRTVVLIGGAPMGRQKSELRANPQILVATPGRLIDHLQTGTVDLDRVKILVLDEADRMLDMGFAPQIERILRAVPRERQTMLFSATMPAEIVDIAKAYMKLPLHVEIAPSGSAAEEISHELFVVKREGKRPLLERVLQKYGGPVLIFSRTKYGARKILRDVQTAGHSGAEIHSNRSLNQRREALDGFKAGKYRVLVATDIAARGIDVTGIELVINYDLPAQAEDYVHRVGRTGRAGRTGHAISFATPDQAAEVRGIEQLMRSELPLSEDSEDTLEPLKSGKRAGRPGARSGPGRSGSAPRPEPGPRAGSGTRSGPGPRSESGSRGESGARSGPGARQERPGLSPRSYTNRDPGSPQNRRTSAPASVDPPASPSAGSPAAPSPGSSGQRTDAGASRASRNRSANYETVAPAVRGGRPQPAGSERAGAGRSGTTRAGTGRTGAGRASGRRAPEAD